jgi:hypothetical protein
MRPISMAPPVVSLSPVQRLMQRLQAEHESEEPGEKALLHSELVPFAPQPLRPSPLNPESALRIELRFSQSPVPHRSHKRRVSYDNQPDKRAKKSQINDRMVLCEPLNIGGAGDNFSKMSLQ